MTVNRAYGSERTDIPTRMGVWFWGNGIRKEHWIPDETGEQWMPKAELEPMVSRGSNYHFQYRDRLGYQSGFPPHHSGMAGC